MKNQDVFPPSFERWLEAERAARKAESELHQRWVGFFFQDGPAPTADEQRRAALLRSVAVVALNDARTEKLTRERQAA